MRDVLHKSQRTDKAAQNASEQDGANDKGTDECEDLLPALGEQYVKVTEVIASGARQLIEVVRTGEHRKLDIGEYRSRQPAAEYQQPEAEDHDDPSDRLKAEYKSLFACIFGSDRCFADRHLFLFVQQLSQQHIQRDADD